MKKKKQSTYYWECIGPIWLNEIKSWFPAQKNKKQTVTKIAVYVGVAVILICSGESNKVLIDILKNGMTYVVVVVWLLLLAFPSFMVADRKLRYSFEFILKENEYSNKNNERACAFIMIMNKSKYNIEDCYVEAKTQDMKSFSQLAWSEINPVAGLEYSHITINSGAVRRADIAVAWEKTDTAVFCIFPLVGDDRIIKPGAYNIEISVFGKIEDDRIRHTEELSFVYQGANKLKLNRN